MCLMLLSFIYIPSTCDVTIAQGPLNIFSLQVGWILSFVNRQHWRDIAGGKGLAYCSGVNVTWAPQVCMLQWLAPAMWAASPAFHSCSTWLLQCPAPAWTAPPVPGSGNACCFSSGQPLQCIVTNGTLWSEDFPRNSGTNHTDLLRTEGIPGIWDFLVYNWGNLK